MGREPAEENGLEVEATTCDSSSPQCLERSQAAEGKGSAGVPVCDSGLAIKTVSLEKSFGLGHTHSQRGVRREREGERARTGEITTS